MRAAVVLLLVLGVLVACSGGGPGAPVQSTEGGAPAVLGGADGSPSDLDGGAPAVSNPAFGQPPSRHTPATGCREGFNACGERCVDFTNDTQNCGACRKNCATAPGVTVCQDSQCEPMTASSCGKLVCGGACVSGIGIDNCGSCFNQCGDTELCVRNACADGLGDGVSCNTGLVIPTGESIEFRYPTGLGKKVFACGSTTPVVTRWFRWTAAKSGDARVEVETGLAGDYIVEIFDAPACEPSAAVGCTHEKRPNERSRWLGVKAQAGATYMIAVGEISAGQQRPILRVDD